ncbi:MAG: hypothetical protein WCP87_00925 [Atribacterota bacterium]
MNIPSPTLEHFRASLPPGETTAPDENANVRFWEDFFQERQSIEDDSMPCCYLSEFDQVLYAGLVGGEVKYISFSYDGLISSMVKPFISDLHSVHNLTLNPEHSLYRTYVHKLQFFREKAAGKFGISHFILIDALNFLFELRGATQSYVDVIENPELVRDAISFAHDLNVWVQETFFREIGLINGGTFSTHVQWMEGRIISESVDPFHLTSTDYFEKWGREPVEKIFSRFDGGVIHLHSNGRHLLESVSQLKGIKAIRLVEERGNPTAISEMKSLHPRRGNVPLVVSLPYEQFVTLLPAHDLMGNVFYMVDGVPDVSTANALMEKVKLYRM